MNILLCPTRRARLSLAFAAVLLAGCASTPAPVLLTLPPAATAIDAPAPPMTRAAPVLALNRIEIPEYLVSRRVRYRAAGSTLAEWPDTYWGERIEIGVSREFTSALRQRLPGWRLCESNCREQSPVASLQVVIDRMDYVRTERQLQASVHLSLWSSDRIPRLLQSDERSYRIAGDGDSAQSQAGALTELLRRIATDAGLRVGPLKTP